MDSWVILFRTVMIDELFLHSNSYRAFFSADSRVSIVSLFDSKKVDASTSRSMTVTPVRLLWYFTNHVPTTLLTRNALVTYRLTFHRYFSCNRGDIKCPVFCDVRFENASSLTCVILIVISRAALNLMQHSVSFDSELLEIVCFRKIFAHFTFDMRLLRLNKSYKRTARYLLGRRRRARTKDYSR